MPAPEDVPALCFSPSRPPSWLSGVRRIPIGDLTEILVDLSEGELIVRQLDLVVAGAHRHLRLVREYHGLRRSEEGFGPGWTFSTGLGQAPDLSAEPLTVTDDQGRVTVLHRDREGRIVKTLDPLGAEAASYAYDALGRLVRHSHVSGLVTEFVWDAEDRLVALTVANSETLRFSYDGMYAISEIDWTGPGHRLRLDFSYGDGRTVVVGPEGRRTIHSFDAQGRPTAVTDPLGNEIRQGWDADGNPVSLTDALGAVLTRTYDHEGRPTGLILPTSARSSLVYGDPAHPGLPTVLRDPAGNELLLAYDGTGRLRQTRTPGRDGVLDARTYHPENGRLATVVDGNSAVTTFVHDADGNLTEVVRPAPLGRTVFRYDGLSRITEVVSGNGRRTGYRTDPAGRLAEVTDEDSGQTLISLSHDELGRVVHKSGPGWSYDFDWLSTVGGSRLVSAVRTAGAEREEIRAAYDQEGALTSLTTAAGTTRYTYDAAGRPASVVTPAGRTAQLTHDAAGRLTGVDLGRGTQEIGYDASGRRTTLTVRDAAGDRLLGVEYGYASGSGADTDVLRSTVVDGEFTGFAYDGLKRLARAGDTVFEYDDAHHLVRLGDVRFTLNAAGQVTLFGETEFVYDGAGNFTEETNPTGSFTYSATHQTLTGVFGGRQVVDVGYDGLGQELPRRITETTVDGRTVTHVLTHGPLGIVRVTDDGVPTDFVRASDGTLLAVITSDGRHFWAVTDQQGSVLALLDEEGGLATRYRYTPHGAVTASGEAAAVNPFRYRGAYQLLRSAHVLDHHLYNGFWGRFTQPDPTGRQYAPYTFADNDPVNSGTWTRHDFWSVLARPHEPAAAVFLPGPDAREEPDVLTGAGPTPDRPPLIAGAPPSRTVHHP
ncbi:DUF6531 domain-containing protein [Streptomyces regalis]|uniref:DUF6531 domain-containing protein n=1 Tax=Streptomyces regalis TaxID=68262 RepID=UPI000AD3966C|nr:DUF6531 domain-containing protein [Streptomyces regalis]